MLGYRVRNLLRLLAWSRACLLPVVLVPQGAVAGLVAVSGARRGIAGSAVAGSAVAGSATSGWPIKMVPMDPCNRQDR